RGAGLGDRRWRDLLERHDAAVRAELGRHAGAEVKTVSDGFLATFSGPARAIGCARAIAAAVRPFGLEVSTRSSSSCLYSSASMRKSANAPRTSRWLAAIPASPVQLPGSGPPTTTYSMSGCAHSAELWSPRSQSA